MNSAPQSVAEPAIEVAYARQTPGRHRNLRNWLAVGGLSVLALAGGGYTVKRTNLLDRVFGRSEADPSMYIVRPVDLSITLTEDGELKPKNSVEVKCELEGQSTILWVVDESTQVKKGDLLVELASDAIKEKLDTEEIELRKLEAAVQAAQQDLELARNENASKVEKASIALQIADLELKRYLEGDYHKSQLAAELAVKQTQMDIERKQDELAKNKALFEKGFVTSVQLKQLEFDLEKAQMQLQQNLLQLEILNSYERPKNEKQKLSDLEQARQELDREQQRASSREAQAVAKLSEQVSLFDSRTRRVNRMREQYAKCKVHSPGDGIVQYPSDDAMWHSGNGNRIAAGEKVFEGQTLIVLPDTSQMIVSTRIHEADRHKVSEGLPCLIRVAAVPDYGFGGRIERIARFADTANRWLNPELKEHTTEILLDDTDAPISPGDSAEVKILIRELSNVLAVPVQCVFSRGSKSFVFVRRGGLSEPVEVKLGGSSESMIEITSGLAADDCVLMHAEERLLSQLPAPAPVESEIKSAGGVKKPGGGGHEKAGRAAPAQGQVQSAAAPGAAAPDSATPNPPVAGAKVEPTASAPAQAQGAPGADAAAPAAKTAKTGAE